MIESCKIVARSLRHSKPDNAKDFEVWKKDVYTIASGFQHAAEKSGDKGFSMSAFYKSCGLERTNPKPKEK